MTARAGWRSAVPWLGGLALLALFFKLPETPDVFGVFGCAACTASSPYLPLLGAGYFALLVATALAFPGFPGPLTARAGLVWAVALAVCLTWFGLPGWCVACLIAHACNIAIWIIWLAVPAVATPPPANVGALRCLVLIAPVSVVALFSCLNLTFLVYDWKAPALGLGGPKPRDTIPDLTLETTEGVRIRIGEQPLALNFVSPECHYCKEQLPLVEEARRTLGSDDIRIVNITPGLTDEMKALAPGATWIPDTGGQIRTQLGIAGVPTLLIVNPDLTVASVHQGVPKTLTKDVVKALSGKP